MILESEARTYGKEKENITFFFVWPSRIHPDPDIYQIPKESHHECWLE